LEAFPDCTLHVLSVAPKIQPLLQQEFMEFTVPGYTQCNKRIPHRCTTYVLSVVL